MKRSQREGVYDVIDVKQEKSSRPTSIQIISRLWIIRDTDWSKSSRNGVTRVQ